MIKSEFNLKLVDKPWGFEFELYDNKLVSIWCVSIGQEHKSGYLLDSSSTSFHMHTAKTAKVVVLDGAVKLSKSDESKILNKSKPYVLPPRTPHKLNAYHGNCILIEIESPSNRSDIIRLSDSYGRSKNKYSWDILDSKKIESWKSELRYKETPYDINITGDAKSPCMILSNGVTVKYIKTSINELLKLSDEDTFIVTEGSMLNSLEESVSIVGDIFDKNYRELFLKNTKLGSHFKNDLSGLLISNDKVK